VKKNSRILILEIGSLNLRFLSHQNYLNGNLYQIASQFQIHVEKQFFPQLLIKRENFDYVAEVPDLQNFITEFDSESVIQEKKQFVESKKHLIWNFSQEFLTYIQQKVFLLAMGNLKFLKEFLNFQKLLGATKFFSPFDKPVSTIGGAFYFLYKLTYLNRFPLFVVLNEYKSKGLNTSRGEHQLMSYIESVRYPNGDFLSAYNNPNGQKYFKEAIPDGYGISDKTCYFYQGCYTHKCVKHNLINNLELCIQTNKDFDDKLTKLLINNPSEIEKIEIIWECEIDQFKKFHPKLETFLRFDYVKRPLQRLIPRDSYKSGYHDTYFLNWSKTDNESVLFYDVNSLFSSVAVKNKFMIGKYTTLIGKTINDLKVVRNKFYFQNFRVMGAIFLSIIPPKTLLYPYLIYKASDGVTYNTLCQKCCESRTKICNHSDTERAITGTYMFNEIEYALELKYTILHIYECHIYTESDYILKDFVNHLLYCKTIATNCFEDCDNEYDKQSYCDKLNKQMGFTENLTIKPTLIQPNEAMRYFYKLAQNSFFGKFGQRSDYARNIYCQTQEEIETVLSENVLLNDAYAISDELCCLNYTDQISLKPSLKTNVYISAQITSYAREDIHKHLMVLASHNVKILKVNCDSILFVLKSNQKCPLNLSHAAGDFKDEISGTILNYFAIGAKNYILVYRDKCGQICHVNKISGLSLNSRPANDENYQEFLTKLNSELSISLQILNKKRKIDWKNLSIESFVENFTISNTFQIRRVIKQTTAITLPYGYKE